MGVSVTSSFAVIVVGAMIAFGVFYSASADSVERIRTAIEGQNERFDRIQETEITVTAAEVVDTTPCTVRVNVTNGGETTLTLSDTDVLVDGVYQTDWRTETRVDGDRDTGNWFPTERLTLNVTVDGTPERATVVTGPGVAATKPITGGSTC
ncbi:MAG: flagellin [Halorientalis sp.]